VQIGVVFIIGNLLSALGPNFEVVLAGRIIAGISLAEARNQGRAVATMLGGLTFANVLGVPLDTASGQQFEWRVVFGFIVAFAVAATLAILAVVPTWRRSRRVSSPICDISSMGRRSWRWASQRSRSAACPAPSPSRPRSGRHSGRVTPGRADSLGWLAGHPVVAAI
jgi:predicted MFS family arabinose efflux permease